MSFSNIKLVFDFPTDKASLQFTSEAGNMLAQFVQTQQPSEIWRSTSLIDQEFIFELEEYTPFSALVLWNINFSIFSQITLSIYLENKSTFERTWPGVEPLYAYSEGPYGSISYGGYSSKYIVNYPFFVKFFEPVPGTKCVIRISDPENSTGYIQAGRIALGNYFSPEYNISYPYNAKYQFQSKQSLTRSGAIRCTKRVKNKIIPISLEYLNLNEALELEKAILESGLDKNILCSVYPDEKSSRETHNIVLGFLKEGSYSGLIHANTNTYKCSFSIIEGK
jgi:hypothetical protein